jgi:superfamily II DNA/RNA helicase
MQRARLKRLDRFKATSNAVLVATDVAGRGLDIKGVEFVVNYQVAHRAPRNNATQCADVAMARLQRRVLQPRVLQPRVLQHGRLQRRALQQVPRSSDDYVHRAGRTARIHHDGQTVRCRFHLAPFPLSAVPAWRNSRLAPFPFRAAPT